MLPCGLATIPSQFMRVMNCLLASDSRQHTLVAVYAEDVLIHSLMREEHLDHVQIVLDHLQKADLKLSRSKYEWFRDEIEFSGSRINEEVVHTLESKTLAITE